MAKKMSGKELAKRYILFIISLFFAGLGVAVTKRGELGVSPVSSVANVLSYQFPIFTLGTWLLIWNSILLLGQILLLRKDFQPVQLLQLPLSFVLSWSTDLGMKLAVVFPNEYYAQKMFLVLLGTGIVALGVSLAVVANVVMNSGEAFVKAIADKTGFVFGNVKIGFDVCCVATAIILSLLFFKGQIVGTREGTVIAALLVGNIVKAYLRLFKAPLEKLLTT